MDTDKSEAFVKGPTCYRCGAETNLLHMPAGSPETVFLRRAVEAEAQSAVLEAGLHDARAQLAAVQSELVSVKAERDEALGQIAQLRLEREAQCGSPLPDDSILVEMAKNLVVVAAERDESRAMFADLCQGVLDIALAMERHPHYKKLAALHGRFLDLHTSMVDDAARPTWADKRDRWSAAVDAAYPTRSGSHDEYVVAMTMVGNRQSKGDLVALVNWLLVRLKLVEARVCEDCRHRVAVREVLDEGKG